MARPAKPTHLKIIQGNPGKRALPKNEPKPQGDLKTPPKYFNAAQKAEWRYIIKHAPAGLLKMIDTSALEVYVVARIIHRQATEQLAKEELIVLSPVQKAPMQNPLVPIINRQAEVMLKAAAQMGFSPASRTKVSVDAPNTPSGFDQFK